MTTYAMLTRLSPSTSYTPETLLALERDVVQRIERECPSLRWVASYVVLGKLRYLDLFEAPDMETALKAGMLVDTYGHAETEIWPLVDWAQFKQNLPRVREGEREAVVRRADGSAIEGVVEYLQRAGAAFRLTSYPVPEPQPAIAHALRPGGQIVQTRVVLVDGRPAIACAPEGLSFDLAGMGAEIGASVLEGSSDDLPGPFRGAPEPLPPLGHLLHVPLLVDESLASCSTLAFRSFSSGAYVEIPYEEFLRIEQPKVLRVAIAGALAAAARLPRVRQTRVGARGRRATAPRRRA